MRWFKHMTDIRSDPEVAQYLGMSRDRLAAYGFFISLLEVVAASMDAQSGRASVTYPSATWRRLCDVHARTLQKQCRLLADCGLIALESNADQIQIEVPKLQQWRDEYSRKVRSVSGQAPDNVAPEGEQKENRGRAEDARGAADARARPEASFQDSREAGSQAIKQIRAELAAPGYLGESNGR